MAFHRFFIFIGVWAACLGGLDAVDLNPYTVVLNALTCVFSKSLNLNVSEVEVHLFDFKYNINSTHKLDEAPAAFLNNSFEPNRTMLTYIPGYNNTMADQEGVLQHLKQYANAYVMIIFHYMYTNAPTSDLLPYLGYYVIRAPYFYDIGLAIAKFIKALINVVGVPLNKFHLMGHSLGAHIGGAACEGFTGMTGNKIPRLSCIDGAGPCFSNPQYKCRSVHADYVDLYHTNAGQLGDKSNLGHANYYANDGTAQPGCPPASFLNVIQSAAAGSCSHETAPFIFTAPVAFAGIWPAKLCDSYDNFINGVCDGNPTSIAGMYSDPTSRGTFYFSTAGYNTTVYNN